MCLFFFY